MLTNDNCTFCDQRSERIFHLLTDRVLAREIWYLALRRCNLQRHAPSLANSDLVDWRLLLRKQLRKEMRKAIGFSGSSSGLVDLERTQPANLPKGETSCRWAGGFNTRRSKRLGICRDSTFFYAFPLAASGITRISLAPSPRQCLW